jgi:zinc finger CCHC domain-containing protein 9
MKRKTTEEASEFVSKDLKAQKPSHEAEPLAIIATGFGEDEHVEKKKRTRHRDKAEIVPEVLLSKSEKEALRRRNRRLRVKESNSICFNCRVKGHSQAKCPTQPKHTHNLLELSDLGSICYRCGSLEHVLQKCKEKKLKDNALPFTTCFVCKQKGHLAGHCPENLKGVYPNGGSCKFCGSVRHLASDCKPLEQKDLITLGVISLDQGGDDDDVFQAITKISANKDAKPAVPKKKVISF